VGELGYLALVVPPGTRGIARLFTWYATAFGGWLIR